MALTGRSMAKSKVLVAVGVVVAGFLAVACAEVISIRPHVLSEDFESYCVELTAEQAEQLAKPIRIGASIERKYQADIRLVSVRDLTVVRLVEVPDQWSRYIVTVQVRIETTESFNEEQKGARRIEVTNLIVNGPLHAPTFVGEIRTGPHLKYAIPYRHTDAELERMGREEALTDLDAVPMPRALAAEQRPASEARRTGPELPHHCPEEFPYRLDT
jgi:hypothetical protein